MSTADQSPLANATDLKCAPQLIKNRTMVHGTHTIEWRHNFGTQHSRGMDAFAK